MFRSDEAKTLRWIDGFDKLTAQEVKKLSMECRWNWYRGDQMILSHEDKSNDVFFIVQGKVRVAIHSLSGKQVSFRDLAVGETFGELAAIDSLPRSASVIALSDSLVASVSAKKYAQILREFPALSTACLNRLAKLIRSLSDRLVEFSTLPVSYRLYAELIRMAVPNKLDTNVWEVKLLPTHAEIASRIATHREAVTRELRKLTREGLISRDGGKLVFSDIEALRVKLRDAKSQV